MTTLSVKKRYKNGKELSAKLKRLPNCFGTGLCWYIVWEDGKEYNTLHSASGKDSFRKKEITLIIN